MSATVDRQHTFVELLEAVAAQPVFDGFALVAVDEHPSELDSERTQQTASGGEFSFSDQYTRQYGHNEAVVVRFTAGFEPLHLTIGRSRTCDVRLTDESVSSHHARLTIDRRIFEVLLEDSGSRNGTTINGAKMPAGERRPLWAGAYLSFGGAVYLFLDSTTLRKLASLRREPR